MKRRPSLSASMPIGACSLSCARAAKLTQMSQLLRAPSFSLHAGAAGVPARIGAPNRAGAGTSAAAVQRAPAGSGHFGDMYAPPAARSPAAGAAGQLIPGRAACAAAVLCFCVAAGGALWPGLGNAEGERQAALLPAWETSLPLHGHLLALSLALMQRWLRRTGTRQTGIVVYVCFISSASAALTATGVVPARVDVWGSVSRPLRIVTWLFTTPAMLLLIADLAGASRAGARAVIAMDVAMLSSGLLALTLPAPWAHGFAVLGLLLLLPLLFALYTMFGAALSKVPAGSLRARAVFTCAWSSMVLWSGFASVFVLCCLGQLSHRAAAGLWAITDVAAKACFAMTLMHASTVTIEESLAEVARASNEARSRQLAQLCHEIRNPLFGVVGHLQELDFDLQLAGTTSPGSIALVATTLACTAQLRRTLDDFLDLAKADAAALRVVRGPTHLRPLLVDICRSVLHAAHEKNLQIFVHVSPALADKVFLLDPGRVTQIVSNFAWNSVKFTSTGSVTLRVSVDGAHVADGDATSGELPLLFEVVDTGLGVSAEAQARLFLPFQTVHDDPTNITQKWGGTGLGLSICRVIAGLLGGTVGVTSAKDAGSTFWLRVRAEWWADPSGAGFPEPGTSAAPGAEHEEVLALSTAGGLRRRRAGPTPNVISEESGEGVVPLPRRHSLDAWVLQARRALGASPAPQRASVDVIRNARPPAAGSLAEQLAAVAAAHVRTGTGSPAGFDGQKGTAVVSSALLATLRTLRQAVGDAEVAVASQLGDRRSSELRRGSSLDVATTRSVDTDTPRRSSFAAAALSPPVVGSASPSALGWPGPLRKVLVVDDEPVNTRLVARRLERLVPEVAVTVAEDGLDLVQLCIEQKQRYDIILLDQHMRGMNGDAAVAALRAYEQSAALPRSLVLACTGNASKQDVERFEHAGFDGVFVKPLDLTTLVPALAALVSGAAVEGVNMFKGGA